MSNSARQINAGWMQVVVNGTTHAVPQDATVAELIELLELGGRRLATELNGEILPRSRYGEQRLRAGDCVEIVHAVGGG